MTLTFNQDPCLDIDNSYRDNNVFKRSVLRIMCKFLSYFGLGSILGQVGLLDNLGNPITPTNPLPVLATVIPSPGGATSANQVLEIAALNSIDGKIVTCDTSNVTITAMPPIVLPPGGATAANQVLEIADLGSIDGKITACDTSNVTIVNAAGAAAVNIQDGGNSITVDGSVAVSSLPAGISTSANQSTEISSLSSIDLVGQATQAIITTLKAILTFLIRPIWLDAATGNVRAILGVGGASTLATVTTVAAVTSVTGANGFNFYAAPQSISNTAWALLVRDRIA